MKRGLVVAAAVLGVQGDGDMNEEGPHTCGNDSGTCVGLGDSATLAVGETTERPGGWLGQAEMETAGFAVAATAGGG